jgi:predicted nucleic-acid-binding protein
MEQSHPGTSLLIPRPSGRSLRRRSPRRPAQRASNAMATSFLDTNILLRFFTKDDEAKAERAFKLLQRVESGQEKVIISSLVVFEAVFTLQHSYKVERPRIRELVEGVLSMPGIQLPKKTTYYKAFEIYASTPLSFADCYNAAYMQELGITQIYSWDEEFDDLPGITRIEPGELKEAA